MLHPKMTHGEVKSGSHKDNDVSMFWWMNPRERVLCCWGPLK